MPRMETYEQLQVSRNIWRIWGCVAYVIAALAVLAKILGS